ncbi:hypothetical protein [Bradyrhizobium sp. CSA207]|nr:hypothetical protein [Bradyrhizobium sp. CSA207]
MVELDSHMIDLLIRLNWLSERDDGNDREVGRAVTLLLADAAKRL